MDLMVVKNIRFKEHDIKNITGKKFGLLGIRFVDDQANGPMKGLISGRK